MWKSLAASAKENSNWKRARVWHWNHQAIMIRLLYLNTNCSPIAAICLPCVKARRGEVANQPKPCWQTCICEHYCVCMCVSLCVNTSVYNYSLPSSADLKRHYFLFAVPSAAKSWLSITVYLVPPQRQGNWEACQPKLKDVNVGEVYKSTKEEEKSDWLTEKNKIKNLVCMTETKTAGFPELCSGLWRNHNTAINSYSPHKHTGISWRYNCSCFSCNLIPYLLLLSDTFSTERPRDSEKEKEMRGRRRSRGLWCICVRWS